MKFPRFFLSLLAAAAVATVGCASPQASTPDRVLVLGANGQLGAAIVRLLVTNGTPVTAIVRENSDRTRLEDDGGMLAPSR